MDEALHEVYNLHSKACQRSVMCQTIVALQANLKGGWGFISSPHTKNIRLEKPGSTDRRGTDRHEWAHLEGNKP